MAQLAIQGHATRGKEVIEILEMLGGQNTRDYTCNIPDYAYSINKQGMIEWFMSHLISPYTIFTLEEFLEKFPYKIGNKVIAYAEGCVAQFTIQDMRWNDELNKIEYRICSSWYDAGLMRLYKEKKEETMEGKNNNNWVKWDLPDGYEFQDKDGNIINTSVIRLVKKQPQYPKTFVKCAKMLDCFGAAHIDGYKCELLESLQELLVCRNAYWKIAGEQMGLGKPWEPDWLNAEQDKFVIYTHDDVICLNNFVLGHNVLAFPTAEMRDAFYENFKSSIEDCKELL